MISVSCPSPLVCCSVFFLGGSLCLATADSEATSGRDSSLGFIFNRDEFQRVASALFVDAPAGCESKSGSISISRSPRLAAQTLSVPRSNPNTGRPSCCRHRLPTSRVRLISRGSAPSGTWDTSSIKSAYTEHSSARNCGVAYGQFHKHTAVCDG